MSFQYSKYGCIITIDFGTTFSGSCYAITGGLTDEMLRLKGNELVKTSDLHKKLKDLDIKNVGLAGEGEYSHKTPTIVIYDQFRQLSSWGIHAKKRIDEDKIKVYDKVFRLFKLSLPKSISQKGSVQRPGSNEQNPEDSNLRATIDFFKVIYDHVYENLYSERVSTAYSFDNNNIRFVITVPAMWTDIERMVMRQVAIQAGLINETDHESRLLIINESLAATLYCERELGPGFLNVGDKYIVCDAGGGTVDIASFLKTDAQPENISFDRCQLTTDVGADCGSTFLDKNMRRLLCNILYDSPEPPKSDDPNVDLKNEKELDKILRDFIDSKNNVTYGKPQFGDGLETHISDEEYFKKHKEDFEELLSCAMTIKNFDEPILIEDTNATLKGHREFKFFRSDEDRWGDEMRYYVNNDNIYYSQTENTLIIPYEVMVNSVFRDVIEQTILLLIRQAKKIGNGLKAIFLVGGLGCSPYLERRIKQKFGENELHIEKSQRGNLAAMRGAAYYGIDGVKRPIQTDIVEEPYYDEKLTTDTYDILVSIDVGYDFTCCQYVKLNKQESEVEPVVVNKWPGLEEGITQIPTAYKVHKGLTLWGATVPNITDADPKDLIVPSRLMSNVNSDLKKYFANFLRCVHEHVLNYIKEKEGKVNTKKIRYTLTMEDSYNFFKRKSDMRSIAINAGIIKTEDATNYKRLLLIKRGDAAAMYFEKEKLPEKNYSSYFMQIFFRHDTCYLTLKESVKISGYADAKDKINNEASYFRNVRGIRSAMVNYNFVAKLINNLDMFVTKNPCIRCKAIIPHSDYYPTFRSELRRGFLKYVKETLDFSVHQNMQEFTIKDDNCCSISISIYDLLEHIFRPAIVELVSEINRYITQTNIINFRMDKIFLADRLFEAKDETYEFLERIFTKTLSEVMNIGNEFIVPAEKINQAAIKGAIQYGLQPESYTERVARKTYMIAVEAYSFKPFEEQGIQERDERPDDINYVYDIESRNAYKDENSPPHDVFYQPTTNPSKVYHVGPKYKTLLIDRGTKILEDHQTNGIVKRFFVRKECLAYATIYTSEQNDLEFPNPVENAFNNEAEIPKSFQKIHQFEIYIKEDKDDPINKFNEPRHYFEVKMIPDNNEFKFEASIGIRIGEKIPEFRFRDEILVANIYDDRTQIKLKETSKMDKNLAEAMQM